ncbi:CDC42 small effector protein 1 [Simochromis diagramma]|uniref:CDC42 small effector protein 1 n=1 Tax=Simochromis diagramma TaxID=43689 RepID=UPI001A7EE821|nr:CDC42 small effector protein 1 [Simochromis diagramma]
MTTATPAEEAAREPSGDDSRSEGAAWPSGTRVCLRSTDPQRRCDDARILRRPGNLQLKKKRRKIDRSMIGEPTNFIHLTHIGSGEMAEGLQPSGSVQEQMRSKGPNMNGRNSLL